MTDADTARELGQLQERVRSLDSKFGALKATFDTNFSQLDAKVDALTTLAERGRGAYWAFGLSFAALGAVGGGAVTWLLKQAANGSN